MQVGIIDMGLIPDWRRSSGGGHGNSFQYSSLENPMDRGAWQATVHIVAQSWVQLKWLSMHVCMQASSETYQSNFEFYVVVELYDILSFIKWMKIYIHKI